jgi:gamma-glutamyltranspeptidase/glutathione hydrolase
MVTGTTGAAAIAGGVEVLKQGGSAADAAMATAMTQICMAVGSWVSYAGIMTMVYFDAASGKTYNLNAAYNTVKGETDPKSIPGFDVAALMAGGFAGTKATPSGRTALVPGFMAGVEAAHERFGKVPLQTVFAPALRCAEDGIPYDAGLHQRVTYRKDVLDRLPETKAVFTKPDGSPYQVGDTLRQPALASTLRTAAQQGIGNYMYRGAWARKLVDLVQRDGGKMTLEDLANYRVIWSEPVHTTYHGYDVYAHGLPADGGVNLIEAMRLADRAGVSSMGPYATSPVALYWLAEISKAASLFSLGAADARPALEAVIGTPLSLESRLDPKTTDKIWQAIQARKIPTLQPPRELPAHSDGVVAIDQWGNIAAVVHSINTVTWGWTGIFVDGISIPDSASFQQDAMARVVPGERLPDPTNPGLVVKDGKPFMGFSSIGSGLHLRTTSALISVIDYGLSPQEAINQPALGIYLPKPDAKPTVPEFLGLTVGSNEFSADYKQRAAALGLNLIDQDATRGYWLGIQIDQKSGELRGGALRELALGGRAVGY